MNMFNRVNTDWPDYPRAALRAKLLELHAANGITPPDGAVDEIVDLACHAAASARTAMFTVLASASDPRSAISAIGPAASFLGHTIDVIRAAQKDFAEAAGLDFTETTIPGAPAHV